MRPLLALFVCFGMAAPAGAGPRVVHTPSSLVYPDFWHTPLGIHRGTPELLHLLLILSGSRRND